MTKKLPYVLSALLIVFAGCGRTEEPKAPPAEPTPAATPAGVTVTTITVGKAVGSDKKISTPAETFAKADTIYVSVDTAGSGTANLKSKWTYRKGADTTTVKEDSQTITPTGPATSEFHISKADGWPAGEYQVEILLDDKPAGTKSFTVK
jgi:hypothetical protein